MPNYSLWLEPTTSTYAPCAKFILDVAHRHPEAPYFPPHVTLVGVEPASRNTQGVSNEPRERTTASDHECFGGEVLEVRACAAELDERCTAV